MRSNVAAEVAVSRKGDGALRVEAKGLQIAQVLVLTKTRFYDRR